MVGAIKSNSNVIFSISDQNTKKKCFFITPIGKENDQVRRDADGLMDEIICPALTHMGFLPENIYVSHKISEPGEIDYQIVRHLFDDDLVIANLTGTNANVMYELAIRHFLGTPLILIALNGTRLPFDVLRQRTVFFDNDIAGAFKLKSNLIDVIRCLDDFKPNNVIQNAAREKKTEEALKEMREVTVPSSQIQELISSVRSLEKDIGKIIENNRISSGLTVNPHLSPLTSTQYDSCIFPNVNESLLTAKPLVDPDKDIFKYTGVPVNEKTKIDLSTHIK